MGPEENLCCILARSRSHARSENSYASSHSSPQSQPECSMRTLVRASTLSKQMLTRVLCLLTFGNCGGAFHSTDSVFIGSKPSILQPSVPRNPSGASGSKNISYAVFCLKKKNAFGARKLLIPSLVVQTVQTSTISAEVMASFRSIF